MQLNWAKNHDGSVKPMIPIHTFVKEHQGAASIDIYPAKGKKPLRVKFILNDGLQVWTNQDAAQQVYDGYDAEKKAFRKSCIKGLFVREYYASGDKLDYIILLDNTAEKVQRIYNSCPSSAYDSDEWGASFTDSFGVVYSKDGRYLLSAPINSEEYCVRKGTKCIINDAFLDADNLRRIYLPDSLEVIGSGAFYGRDTLEFVDFPDSLRIIGFKAFCGCGIRNLILPHHLAIIEAQAFFACENLSFVFIPESVISIGEAIFENCGDIKQIIVSPNNQLFDSRNDCNGIINSLAGELIAGCGSTRIPDSVISVNKDAYSWNRYKKSTVKHYSTGDDEDSVMMALSRGYGDYYGFE